MNQAWSLVHPLSAKPKQHSRVSEDFMAAYAPPDDMGLSWKHLRTEFEGCAPVSVPRHLPDPVCTTNPFDPKSARIRRAVLYRRLERRGHDVSEHGCLFAPELLEVSIETGCSIKCRHGVNEADRRVPRRKRQTPCAPLECRPRPQTPRHANRHPSTTPGLLRGLQRRSCGANR